jgi:ATP-dependent Clp protease ATP-binding subunit ClpC
MYQFNGFTEKANKAMNLAIDAAKNLGHTYIGSEHMLLGLLEENTGVAATVLQKLGVTHEKLEQLMREQIGVGSQTHVTIDDLTPRTKRILQRAVMHASQLHHNYVGTAVSSTTQEKPLPTALPAATGRQRHWINSAET